MRNIKWVRKSLFFAFRVHTEAASHYIQSDNDDRQLQNDQRRFYKIISISFLHATESLR